LVSHNGEERRLKMLESMVLRKIFEPKRDEVTVEWGKLHSERSLMICTSSINVIRLIKSRRISWGERRDAYSVLMGKPK